MNLSVQSIILDFPQLRQTFNYDCGDIVIESVLAYYGIEVREDVLINQVKTNISDGTRIENIIAIFHKYNLQSYSREMLVDDIKEYINQNIPVILVLQAWTEQEKVDWKNDWDDGHYVVAIGYDREKIYFEDPSAFERTYLTFEELRKRWHDIDVSGQRYYNYAIAVYGKKPKFSNHKIIHMD